MSHEELALKGQDAPVPTTSSTPPHSAREERGEGQGQGGEAEVESKAETTLGAASTADGTVVSGLELPSTPTSASGSGSTSTSTFIGGTASSSNTDDTMSEDPLQHNKQPQPAQLQSQPQLQLQRPSLKRERSESLGSAYTSAAATAAVPSRNRRASLSAMLPTAPSSSESARSYIATGDPMHPLHNPKRGGRRRGSGMSSANSARRGVCVCTVNLRLTSEWKQTQA